uniref:Uncharacterized protein n=1 Tax=Brassica oleracea TaxID=3712 RepID=A0A3P6EK39_BRAOL|nr:unnamed protein product [Brassica oleracea]
MMQISKSSSLRVKQTPINQLFITCLILHISNNIATKLL